MRCEIGYRTPDFGHRPGGMYGKQMLDLHPPVRVLVCNHKGTDGGILPVGTLRLKSSKALHNTYT